MRLLILKLLFVVLCFPIVSKAQSAQTSKIEKFEREIFAAVNEVRIKDGKNPLIFDADLALIARNYSQRMADEKFFSHYDKEGKDLSKRLKNTKFDNWERIAENIFFSPGDKNLTQIAMEIWLKSAGHRKNLLSSESEITGIGIGISQQGHIYVTGIFLKMPAK